MQQKGENAPQSPAPYYLRTDDADPNSPDLFLRAKAYDIGIGVAQDKHKAALLYRQAFEAGSMKAKHNLAIMYIYQDDEMHHPEEGIRMLQELADEGEDVSIFCLGQCYLEGKEVEKNIEQATMLFKTASEKGNALATYYLGICYFNEFGDKVKGLEYIKKAADQGCSFANHTMADLHERGELVEKDFAKSMYYLERAAEQGDAMCQCKLGYLIMHVYHDFITGVRWIRKSIEYGFEGGIELLDSLGIKDEMTSDKRTMAFFDALENTNKEEGQKAFDKMCECCRLGDPFAQYILGVMYYGGNYVEQDQEKGMNLLYLSANQEFVDAISAIGLFLNEQGQYEEANRFHRKAAELGDSHGIHNLGNAYFYARGVEKDEEKAVKLWMEAARKGNPNAMCALGNCCLEGRILPQNIDKAIELFTNAANQGDIRSMKRLVEVYHALGDYQNSKYWEDMMNPN